MSIDDDYKEVLRDIVWNERKFLKRVFYLYKRKYYGMVWPHLGYMKIGREVFFDSKKVKFIYEGGKEGYDKYYNTDDKKSRYWIHPNWYYSTSTYMLEEHNNSNREKHFKFRDKIYDIVSYYYLNNLIQLYNLQCYYNVSLLQRTLIAILEPILLNKYRNSTTELFNFIQKLEHGILIFGDLKQN